MKQYLTIIVSFLCVSLSANDVSITLQTPLKPVQVNVNGQDKNFVEVRYDLQWKNSWRYGDGSNGIVLHVAIRKGDSDYTDGVHDIVFSGGNASENATAKVKVTSGKISEIIEFTGGKDYVLSPTGFTGLSTSGVEAVFDVHIASWWDAVWVFMKFKKKGTNEWKHAVLSNSGHQPGQGTSLTLKTGLVNEEIAYHATNNPISGIYLYRSQTGSGTSAVQNALLTWDYEANGLSDLEEDDVQLYGIEMVYVPEGAFYVGTGGIETGGFYNYPSTSSPFLVASAAAIEVGSQNGKLYYNNASSQIYGDQSGPVPSGFPSGYSAFYAMKYEITQQ